jgi:hypothetical protein
MFVLNRAVYVVLSTVLPPLAAVAMKKFSEVVA